MKNLHEKSRDELILELKESEQRYDALRKTFEKGLAERENEILMMEKLSKATAELIQFHDDIHDYSKILNVVLETAGARFASFNIFDTNGLDFTTVAVAGNTEKLKKGLSTLGFDVINKKWKHDQHRADATKNHTITRFKNFHDLTNDVITKSVVYLAEKTFGIGEAFVVKIAKDQKVLGDFTLLFDKNETLTNNKLVELYANQVGLFLDRKNTIASLLKSEEQYKSLFENTGTSIVILEEDTTISLANEEFAQRTGYHRAEIENRKKWTEIVEKEDIKWMLGQHQLRRDNSSFAIPVYEFRFRTKSGELRYALINVQLIPGTNKTLASMIDITKRKKAEKELVRSEQLFELFFSQSYMGFYFMMIDNPFEWNAQTDKEITLDYVFENLKFTKVNKAFLEQYNAKESEFIGKTLNDQFAGNIEHGRKVWTDFLNLGKKIRMETNETTVDGNPIYIEGDYFCMYDEKGRIFGIFGVQMNITSRKKAEADLAESQSNLRAVFNATDESIYLVSDDSTILAINDVGAKRMQNLPEEMIGHKISDLLPADMVKSRNPKFDEVILSGKSTTFEDIRFGHWVSNNIYPIKDDTGKVIRMAIYSRDITEQKKAEELLAQSHTNFETFFNTIDDLLFVLDEQGNIIHTNKTVNERLGYAEEELKGQSVLMVHAAERREEAGRIVGEMLSGKTEFCPIPVITKSGMQIPVETRITQGYWNGKPAIFGVTKDISKLRLSEEKFSKLFHLNPSACGLSDLENHQYAEVNDAFYTLFGFRKDEVIGKTAEELGIFEHETRKQLTNEADKNGNFTNVEASLTAKNKEIIHALLSAENIYIQDKKYRFTIAHDITDRKNAETALIESEEKFKTLFENANDAIFILQYDTFIDCNQKTEILFNCKKSDIIGHTVAEYSPPEQTDGESSTAKAKRKLDAALEGTSPFFEWKHLRKDGSSFDTEVSLNKVEINGEIYLQAIVRDISERKRAQDAIIESELRYRTLFETSPAGVIVFDDRGIILEANEAISASTLYPHEELIGSNLQNLAEPGQEQLIPDSIKRMLDGEILVQEINVRRKDNQICIFIIRETAFTLPNGQLGFIAISNDITLRKQAEDSILESEARFRNMADTAPVLIWMAEPTNICTYVNKTWLDFTGRTIEQEIGEGWAKGIYPDDVQNCINVYTNASENQLKYTLEYRLRRADNTYRWLLENGAPRFTPDGRFVGYIGTCIDITEHKQAEAEIISKNLELATLNSEKDKFFSIISHDLRGPFSGFLKLTEYMAEGLSGMTQEDIQRIALVLKKSAANLFSLLGNLLDWSRMQQGLLKFDPMSFKLMTKVQESMVIVLESADEKGISINYHISDNLIVTIDSNMFEGIIRNLTINAVKFTPKGGKVTISAQASSENEIMVSIKDTGIGMNKDILSKLFLLSENVNRRGTEDEPSTGLGLIICKDFVEKHGGKIWVESAENKGSTFYFTIPGFVQTDPDELNKRNKPIRNRPEISKNLAILIAEDDNASEILIREAVKNYSDHITSVSDGHDAVRACLDNPGFDLILMDINMSGIDGYEATRQIRSFNSKVVIIAQTAYGMFGDRELAIDAGCDDYISKPIDIVNLRSLIDSYF